MLAPPTPAPLPSAADRLPLLCSTGVGMIFGLMFALPSGYSYGAGLLLVLSFWCASAPSCRPYRQSVAMSFEDRMLAWSLLAYFLVALASTAWLGNDFGDLDQPLRAALAVPLLWMLCRVPYEARWL
ncbi:MAG: hypothetical protein WCX93_08135, partial [Burkholderiaceae bacterium]